MLQHSNIMSSGIVPHRQGRRCSGDIGRREDSQPRYAGHEVAAA